MSVNKLRFLQNLLALSTATLIITIWATVSFVYYQNKLLKDYSINTTNNKPKQIPTSTQPANNTDSENEYENIRENTINTGFYKGWVEYTSYDDSYSIKYPPNIYSRQNCIGESFLLVEKNPSSQSSEPHRCDRDSRYHLEISVNDKPETIPITDNYYNVTIEEITVDGLPTNIYVSDLTYEPGNYEMQWREWFKEVFIERNGKYYKIYFQDKENEDVFNQILSTFKFLDQTIKNQSNTQYHSLSFITNMLAAIPTFLLPEGIEKTQLADAQKISDYYYVKFLKSSMNIRINSKIQRSGMLYAKDGDSSWKIFYEIKDLATKNISSFKNNPYDFWKEGDSFYTVIVDTNGAGSGEGTGKLVKINSIAKEWKVIDCFYYNFHSFKNFITSSPEEIPFSDRVISYNQPFPEINSQEEYKFDEISGKFTVNGIIDEACTLFELEL